MLGNEGMKLSVCIHIHSRVSCSSVLVGAADSPDLPWARCQGEAVGGVGTCAAHVP